MTALAGGPRSTDPGRSRPDDDPAAAQATPPANADRALHARDSDHVFQAARDQYIVSPATRPVPSVMVTNTLPRDTAAFIGRDDELETLFATVTRAVESGETIPIYTIDGMPGVGKTALAVHAAHLLVDQFPDGQLFVDLHAHTAGQGPAEPADVLAALLSIDGVHHREIPGGHDERAARWRARMAGKRALIIVDNAVGHAQVESLLPGAAGCLVLITSRRRLAGLWVRHAAVPLSLRTLPSDQAAALFVALARRQFFDKENQAVAELVRLCGYLPLAISLLAAKLRPEPLWTVTELVHEITATQDRLAYMRTEGMAVTAAFDLSYHYLPTARRRLFRRLGLHPGVEIDAYAAAALDDIGVAEARWNLEALYDDHLLDQPVRGRYRMHDLARDYARWRLADDPATEQEQAIGRVLDYYHSAAAIGNEYLAYRPRSMSSPPFAVPVMTNADQAMQWMRTERANLMACVAYARDRGLERRLTGFASALAAYLGRTGPWHQAIGLHRGAIEAARRQGDRSAEADLQYELSVLLRQSGDYAGAKQGLQRALTLCGDLEDRLREADVIAELGTVYRRTKGLRAAADVLQRALAIYRELGDGKGQARTLNGLASVRYLTDDFPQATQALQQALTIYADIDDPPGRAHALLLLGVVRRLTDDYPGAIQTLQKALTAYCQLDDRLGEANTRHNLGVVRRMTGDYLQAERWLRDGMARYEEIGDRMGQANAQKQLGVVRRLTGYYPAAIQRFAAALAIYDDLGDRLGRASVLASRGVLHRLAGDPEQASGELGEALTIYRDLNSRLGQAEVLNETGRLLLQREDVSQALGRHELALGLAIEAHSSLEEAHAIEGIARCALRTDDLDGAVARMRQAFEMYRRIGVPEATRAAGSLADMEAAPPAG